MLTDDAMAAGLQMLRSRLANRGITGDTVRAVAACGLVVEAWRDVLEPLHWLFRDAEMAHMSAVTCRDLLPYIRLDGADRDAILRVIRNPDRPLLAGKTAHAVLGKHWRRVRTEVTRRINTDVALESEVAVYALAYRGDMVASEWWGHPKYARLVDEFVGSLEGPPSGFSGGIDDLRTALLRAPWSVPLDVWQWCLENGLAWDSRKSEAPSRRPVISEPGGPPGRT